jgi:hypothetical protein
MIATFAARACARRSSVLPDAAGEPRHLRPVVVRRATPRDLTCAESGIEGANRRHAAMVSSCSRAMPGRFHLRGDVAFERLLYS